MEEKKIVTAEEIMDKAKELGYDVSLDECEEAAELVNNSPIPEENGEVADLSEDALEDVVGGASAASILKWVQNMWKNRPGKSAGKISSWEKGIISAATKKFGWKACAITTGFFLLY